jgi:hypothetical protein
MGEPILSVKRINKRFGRLVFPSGMVETPRLEAKEKFAKWLANPS